jgi:glycosyltransferase involved in cell wall biosynthesis
MEPRESDLGDERGPTLHVAALPFPSRQGTQVAIAQMLGELQRCGGDHQLLSYAHGIVGEALPFPVHRAREWVPGGSLRSGPSWRKLIADVALSRELTRQTRRLRPHSIVAHHVEAAAIAPNTLPLLFFAHTDLGCELPDYAHPRLKRPLSISGAMLDRWLLHRAHAVAAVSPALAARMRQLAAADASKVHYVPVPFTPPLPITQRERTDCRARLGIPSETRVLGYTGNLDRYQGIAVLIAALARVRRDAHDAILLVGTASDPAPLLANAQQAGVGWHVRVLEIASETARRELHAAIDLAIVPRRSPGGVPIKLLDAMSRGVACVVTEAARSGLPIEGAAQLVSTGDADAIAHAAWLLLGDHARRHALAIQARRYVETHHGAANFLQAFDAACRSASKRCAVRRDRDKRGLAT